jgi:hypothetical protein
MSEPTVPDPKQRPAGFVPVIEQAKGIVMAHCRCGPEAAFEILCGISQHANVKLRTLAERMVQQVSPQHQIAILITWDSRCWHERGHPGRSTSSTSAAVKGRGNRGCLRLP